MKTKPTRHPWLATLLAQLGGSKRSVKKLRGMTDLQIRTEGLRSELKAGLRFAILRRDGYRCRICSGTGKLHVDHKVPLTKGGTNDPANLWTLCERCNLGKGARDL